MPGVGDAGQSAPTAPVGPANQGSSFCVEIERKFLIRSDAWTRDITRTYHITDHLIARFEAGKARIRICNAVATLTLKGRKHGLTRKEYHIPLKPHVAQGLIDEFASAPPIEKNRHEVLVAGLVWQVDEYRGSLTGFVTADVELPSEHHALVLPGWAGHEVTHDCRFGVSALTEAANQGPAALAALFRAASLLGERIGMDVK